MNGKIKRTLLLIIVTVLMAFVFTGCDWFVGLFDPLIGTWQRSYSLGIDVTETYSFKGDGSWQFVTNNPFDQSGSGTYTKNDSANTVTLTPTVGWTTARTYTFSYSEDKKTLTLTESGGGTAAFSKVQ